MSGKLCIVGYHQGGTRAIPLGHWNWMAFQIVNAHFRETETIMSGMRAGMKLVNAGVLDVSSLVSNVYPLADIAVGTEVARSGVEPALVQMREQCPDKHRVRLHGSTHRVANTDDALGDPTSAERNLIHLAGSSVG